MSKGKKDSKKEPVAIITYDYSEDRPQLYATGTRIIVMGPVLNKLNFFIDDPQDELQEETVYIIDGKQSIEPSRRRYKGTKRINRRVIASIMMPMSSLKSLADVLTNLVKEHESGVTE